MTYTRYMDATTMGSVEVAGSNWTRSMLTTLAGSSVPAFSIPNGIGVQEVDWAIVNPGDPGSATWATGDWQQLVEVTAAGTLVTLRLYLVRMSAAGVPLEAYGHDGGAAVSCATTGSKVFNWTAVAWGVTGPAVAATDRLGIRYEWRNTFSSARTIRIQCGTTASALTGPLVEGVAATAAATSPSALAVADLQRVYLHDGNTGRRIAQLESIDDVQRAYLLGDVGTASLRVAPSDAAIAETDPMLGRILVIESDAYPFPWVGVVTERDQSRGAESVGVFAREFSGLLDRRYTPQLLRVSGSPVECIRQVVEGSGGAAGLGLRFESAWSAGATSGSAVQAEFQREPVRSALDAICAASLLPVEWWLEYDASQTTLAATLRVGHRGVGRHRAAALVDQGAVTWTSWRGSGEGLAYSVAIVGGQESPVQPWSDRPTGEASVAGDVPRAAHGLAYEYLDASAPVTTRHERVQIAEHLRALDRVADAATAALGGFGVARTLTLTVRQGTVWRALDVGSTVALRLPGAFLEDFDGVARIVGVQPREQSSEMDLAVQILAERPGR